MKSAYSITLDVESTSPVKCGWIWKIDSLPRIKTFLWQCAYDSIGVKGCLVRRGMGEDDRCPVCHLEFESVLHALRDCSRVMAVWTQLGVEAWNQGFWNSNLQDWLSTNEKANNNFIWGKPYWRLLFPFAVWLIWRIRNQLVFNGKNPNLNLPLVINSQVVEFMHCVPSLRQPTQSVIRRVRWERPPSGWKKLNTDGSCIGNLRSSGCGGAVRDEHGEWIAGFSRYIGTSSSIVAEMWALRDGLVLCKNLNIQCLVVELDANMIVNVLTKPDYANNIISPILDDCKQMLTQFQQVQIRHFFRQANCCADLMARKGAEQQLDYCAFSSPPVDVLKIFRKDLDGKFCNRLCPDGAVRF